MSQSTQGNYLLCSLSAHDLRLLQPHLQRVQLPIRFVLEYPNRPIEAVCFPDGGLLSVIAVAKHDHRIEVGLIGRDGMSGLGVVQGDDRTATETFVQVAGTGQQMDSAPLREAMARSPSLQLCFLRYSKAFALQTAYTALANGKATVDERLARWLLMAHDRATGDDLSLTHEFLALMLGVRRAGVTNALRDLENKNLILRTRGVLQVSDRPGLERFANGFYGVSDAEQHRLTGWSGKWAHS